MSIEESLNALEKRLDTAMNGSPSGLQKPVSYIISLVETYVCLQNGTNGKLEYYSTNTSAVFNAAFGNLTNGGIVLVRGGLYNFTNPFCVSNNSGLYGEGYATHFYLANNRPNSSHDNWVQWCFIITDESKSIENVTVDSVRFDGNYLNNPKLGNITHDTGCIVAYSARHWRVQNCWFENHRFIGLDFAAYTQSSYDNVVTNCHFINDQSKGLQFDGGSLGALYECEVSDNYFSGSISDIAFDCSGKAHDIIFEGNLIGNVTGTLGGSNDRSGIKIEDSSCCIISDNIIYAAECISDSNNGLGNNTIAYNQCHIVDSIKGAEPVGIHISTSHNTVVGNTLYDHSENSTYGILIDSFARSNLVESNKFHQINSKGWDCGIQDKGTDNVYIFNDVSEAQTAFSLLGQNPIIRFNIGYNTGYGADAQTASYIVYTDGTNYYAKNGTTGQIDQQSTNGINLLQYAVNNCPPDGSVYIQAGISLTSGTLVLNRTNVNLLTSTSVGNVLIYNLTLDSATGNLADMLIRGLYFNNICFNCPANIIQHIHFEDCKVMLDGTTDGIVFAGPINDAGEIHNIYFTRCYFYDGGQATASRHGFVSIGFNNTGNGQLYFEDCTYSADMMANSFLCCETNGLWSPDVLVRGCDFVESGTSSSYSLVLVKTQSYDNMGLGAARFSNNWIELHRPTTVLQVESDPNDLNLGCTFDHNDISLSGYDLVLIQNNNSNWGGSLSGVPNEFVFQDNRIFNWNEHVILGNAKEAGKFGVITRGNDGYNPLGNVANPISGLFLVDSGSGSIQNSTQYTCWESDKYIYFMGGIITYVQVDGTNVATSTDCMVFVPAGQTFKVVWSSEPTIRVMGN
jgi:hypothetical protein